MGEASYGVRLRDAFSGPGGVVVAAMKRMRGAARALKSSLTAAAVGEGKVAHAARVVGVNVRQAGRALQRFGGRVRAAASKLSEFASSSLGVKIGLAGIGVAGLLMARRIVEGLGRVTAAFAKALVRSAAFGEGMAFSLSKFLGSAGTAQVEMGRLLDVSDQLGISFQEAAGTFKSFVSAGLTADAAREMVKFRADLLAVATTEKDIERVGEAFMQIEKAIATGRLEMDGFTSILAGLPGVTEDTIFAKLAPMMGKTAAELKKMEKTKLPVPELLKAIKAAFLDATGATELGAAAIEKQLSTVSGAFEAFKNVATNALIRVGTGASPELKKTLLPIFHELRAALTGAAFKTALGRLAEGMVRLAGAAATVFKEFGGADAAVAAFDKMAGSLGTIAGAIKTAAPIVKGLTKAFVSGFDAMAGPIEAVWEMVGKFSGMDTSQMSGLEMALKAIGFAAGLVVAAIGLMVGTVAGAIATLGGIASKGWELAQMIGRGFVEIWSTIGGALSSAYAAVAGWASGLWTSITGAISGFSMSSLGSGLIDGLVSGISAGAEGVITALVGVVNDAIARAKKLLGIDSPSKVFMEMGQQSAKGYEQGMSEGAAGIRQATSSALQPPAAGGFGGGTTNNVSQSFSVPVSVDGAGDPEEVAREVGRQLQSKLGSAMAKLALQYAAA